MDMNIVCLDLEGVLVPEIWIAFAEASGIPELKRTTRDEPDYDKLMKWRIGILKEHGLGLKEIQDTIAKIDPIPGAKEFLDELKSITQVIIISDTFTQFAGPLMKKLGYPTIFCNSLEVADNGEITGCVVDGPLSLDMAIDEEAAKHKGGADRKITGDADVLLFPDIHAGNLVYKTLTHLCEVKNGNILTGTAAPVILTSRSDTCETKLYSIALAAVVAEELKKTK